MRERLTPPWWVYLIGLILPTMLGVAYGAAFGVVPGAAVGIAGVLLVGLLLWRTSPVVEVLADGGLRAGRATLPHWAITSATAITVTEARERLRSNAAAYLVLRAWYSDHVLALSLDDPEDPHRAWYVSVRDPSAFALAITSR